MKDFFISYNRADRAWAEWIAWQLEAARYSTVLQAWDFQPGSNFVVKMNEAIREAERTIAVLSQQYLDAQFTYSEWAAAFAQDPTGEKGLLLPVRIAECDLKGLLGQIIYIDLVGLAEATAIEVLLHGARPRTDQKHRSKPPVPPAFPGAAPVRPAFPGTPSLDPRPVEERNASDTRLIPATIPNNLPLELDNFIGREHEIAKIKDLLAEAHLVTLTGEGGIGKSRLARQCAAEMLPQYQDGIFLVELASLIEAELVPQTIAIELGVLEEPGRPLTRTLTDYLRTKKLLLMLDNCEHLVDTCATMAQMFLRFCPHLKILVTSREALRVRGERTWTVPPLSAPDPQDLLPVEQLEQYEAVRLFVDRIKANEECALTITAQNAEVLANICYQLDGLPLAIELAAARCEDLLTVEHIAAQLTDRFRLLDLGDRGALPHQQKMWATIEWSYQSLSAAECLLFNRLSVFAGGWTLEAADAVCRCEQVANEGILNLLSNLRRKSLVRRVESPDDQLRYRFLQTIREFGLLQLGVSEEASMIRRRHAEYYLALTETAEPRLLDSGQSLWLRRLEREHDNLRAVLNWSQGTEDGKEIGLRLAGALWRFWLVRGYLNEGLSLLEDVITTDNSASTVVRAKAFFTAGSLARAQDNYPSASEFYQQSLALYQQVGDKKGIAWTLHDLGSVAHARGDSIATTDLYEQSLALFRSLNDNSGIAWTLHYLGRFAWGQRDYTQALALLKESLDLFRHLGDTWGMGWSLHDLGNVVRYQGDYKQATTYYEESIAVFQDLGDKRGVAWSLRNVGAGEHAQQHYTRATERYQESLALFQDLGDKRGVAWTLHNLGNVARDTGSPAQAIQYYAQSIKEFQRLNDTWGIAEAFHNLGNVARTQGQYIRATRLIAAAQTLREALGVPLLPTAQAVYDADCAALQAALEAAAFVAAWAEGRSMPLERAVAYALAAE